MGGFFFFFLKVPANISFSKSQAFFGLFLRHYSKPEHNSGNSGNLAHRISSKSSGFISRIHLAKSPLKVFENLETNQIINHKLFWHQTRLVRWHPLSKHFLQAYCQTENTAHIWNASFNALTQLHQRGLQFPNSNREASHGCPARIWERGRTEVVWLAAASNIRGFLNLSSPFFLFFFSVHSRSATCRAACRAGKFTSKTPAMGGKHVLCCPNTHCAFCLGWHSHAVSFTHDALGTCTVCRYKSRFKSVLSVVADWFKGLI